MADNISVTPGTGKTIAADDVSGVLYQRIKLSVGVDGSADDVDGDKGDASSATLRVAIADDDTNASRILTSTGPLAAGSALATTAFMVGAQYNADLPAMTDGQQGSMQLDADGAVLSRSVPLAMYVNGNASNTDGASTACIAAQGAGVKTYLTDISLANTSESAITVAIKDGTTVVWTFAVPAGGGFSMSFSSPLAGTANSAWNFDPSAAATTVYCSMSGFTSAI